MINMQDFIESNKFFKKIKVDDLLFVEFKCPTNESTDSVWWHNNHFDYVLTGETRLKSLKEEYTLGKNDCIFARKGSITIQSHIQENFCELMIFVPDNFIRATVQKYKIKINPVAEKVESDTIIPLSNNEVLDSYFQSLAIYFAQEIPPAPELLKIKFEELLVTILTDKKKYPALNYYFVQICKSKKPLMREIMEDNFYKNLSLEEFSRLCGRSLSAFKLEFKTIFHSAPGKWLKEKRLEYSRFLLETTTCSIEEICDLAGFENKSHFIRIFRNRFNIPPGQYRKKLYN